MSTKDNKPDLSNLKSRLGLSKSAGKEKKDSATKSPADSGGHESPRQSAGHSGGTASTKDRLSALKDSTLQSQEPQATAGSGAAQPAQPSQPQQVSAAAAPSQAPRPKAGPPPGAQGPPPTAQAPLKPQKQQAEASSSQGVSADFDDSDIDLAEFDLDQGSMFSPPVLVLFGVLLVVGLIFGFLASTSGQTRSIEQARIDDASQLQEQMAPRIEDFAAAHEIIEGLDPNNVDFQAAEQLGDINFTLDARSLPGNRILLGDQIVGPLHHFMAEANVLHRLMIEHYRATTGADREELEAFIDELDKVGEGKQIAVVFDLPALQRHFISDEEPHEYSPLKGRLVSIDEDAEPDEDGSIRVHVLASDAPDDLDVRSLVPIVTEDFIDVDTDNAMQRYQKRVAELQDIADDLATRLGHLETAINEAADADSPPLLTLRASAPEEPEDEDEQLGQDDIEDE